MVDPDSERAVRVIVTECWRPVVGYEGRYEVSDQGRVYSLRTGRYLRAGMDRRHRHVSLANGDGGKSHRVHKLVMDAFVGPCPEGLEVRHRDDDPDNNRLGNLVYGTRSENMLDRVRNGTHHYSRRTHCGYGHEFTPENTTYQAKGARRCRQCKRDAGRAYAQQKRASRAALV